MIAAIHAARRRKREAAEKAATRTSAAVGSDIDCSDAESVTLEESTHSTARSVPADSNTKLRWEEISLPPPRSICFCLPRQLDVFRFYISQPVQILTAVLIISNFLFNCAEKEWDPYAEQLRPALWKWSEFTFNTLFLVELLVNFYGLAFAFWRHNCGWNCFDLLVVSIGCVGMAEAIGGAFMPPQLALVRNLRAFRIFRLFKRVKSLNKILSSLGKAIPGVFNAFLITIIVMCIYAILGVDFFHLTGDDGGITTYNENVRRGLCNETEDGRTVYVDDGNDYLAGEDCSLTQTFSSETARGFTYGEEYYGTFFRALYTLFQVLTGESWSEAVARPAIFSGDTGVGPALFYVSFIIVCQIVLINVVVAVLLDKMVEEEDAPDPEEMSVIEKLHQMLAQEYGQLQALFRSWDDDGSGTVSRREWCKAIQSLGYRGPRSVLHQIFDSMDRDKSGELDFAEIDKILNPKQARKSSLGQPQPKRSVKDEVTLLRDDVARLTMLVEEMCAKRKSSGEFLSPREPTEPPPAGTIPLARLQDAAELPDSPAESESGSRRRRVFA
ncbi:voltage dependent ion channel [Emiliania huxleyi CCMP1516]|uniref:EF-hand domain-containing protein n=2 Tax=Emiliania huxleyi TaxID=2903 RepID=A0A0D3JL74_EMIH1|nr:voltage dependent ion channel [Emiliania huxleyi CCMP1516]EOD24259.1 voltage dependent ion channel [Emiliania huxleyi CCMP1516]|eukprot:XP_005776688.1 voltage dependent ion channel [Emiliania huxleyi CCMP1516]